MTIQLNRLLIAVIFLFGCIPQSHSSDQAYYGDTPKVPFCDLPKYEGQLVFIQGVYSGVDEYWAVNATKTCKKTLNVELDYYKDGKPIPPKYQRLFDSAYFSYWNTYLIIQATGRYESKNPNGYGHLGSNKSRFILEDIIDVKVINRR